MAELAPWEKDQVVTPANTDKPWEQDPQVNPSADANQITMPAKGIYHGQILPFEKNMDTGQVSWAVPGMLQSIADSATSMVTAPGRAMTGELPVTDMSGKTSKEAIGEGLNTGLWLFGPSEAPLAKTTVEELATAKAARPGNVVGLAADRIGVDLPKSVTSDSRIIQSTGKALENQPIIGSPLIQAQDAARNQLGTALEETQRAYGTGSIPNAGSLARENIVKYSQGKDSVLGKLATEKYDAVDALVTPNVTTPLSSTSKVALDLRARDLNAEIPGQNKAAEFVSNAISKPGGLNYQGIKDLRTRVGEMMDNPSLVPPDMSGKDLKRIYGALTEDYKKAAFRAGGQKAVDALNEADRFNVKISAERESLQRILGTAKSDEGIFDTIRAMAGSTSRADIKKLALARQAVGADTWDEISSAVLANMGRDAEGNFSPERFLTARGKLSDMGRAMLFNTTGKKDLAKSLDDIAAVSSRIDELNKKFGNPSGTARNAGYAAMGAGFITGVFAHPIRTVTSAVSGILGGNVMARYLAKPEIAKSIADYSKAYEAAASNPNTATNFFFGARAQKLASILAKEAGDPSLAGSILSRIGSVQHAGANDQNTKDIGGPITDPQAENPDQRFNNAYLQGQAF